MADARELVGRWSELRCPSCGASIVTEPHSHGGAVKTLWERIEALAEEWCSIADRTPGTMIRFDLAEQRLRTILDETREEERRCGCRLNPECPERHVGFLRYRGRRKPDVWLGDDLCDDEPTDTEEVMPDAEQRSDRDPDGADGREQTINAIESEGPSGADVDAFVEWLEDRDDVADHPLDVLEWFWQRFAWRLTDSDSTVSDEEADERLPRPDDPDFIGWEVRNAPDAKGLIFYSVGLPKWEWGRHVTEVWKTRRVVIGADTGILPREG